MPTNPSTDQGRIELQGSDEGDYVQYRNGELEVGYDDGLTAVTLTDADRHRLVALLSDPVPDQSERDERWRIIICNEHDLPTFEQPHPSCSCSPIGNGTRYVEVTPASLLAQARAERDKWLDETNDVGADLSRLEDDFLAISDAIFDDGRAANDDGMKQRIAELREAEADRDRYRAALEMTNEAIWAEANRLAASEREAAKNDRLREVCKLTRAALSPTPSES